MSNTAYIKQGTFTCRHDGEKSKRVIFYDGYGTEYILLDFYGESFYDDDIELLDFIMGLCQTEDRDNARAILDNIEEIKCGMFINGEFYDWEKLKPLFKEYHLDFSQD